MSKYLIMSINLWQYSKLVHLQKIIITRGGEITGIQIVLAAYCKLLSKRKMENQLNSILTLQNENHFGFISFRKFLKIIIMEK